MNCEVIIVLGMHRSGTSAITRGLKALGVELGGRLIDPGADNPRGFWENEDILNINITLLDVFGLRWDSLSLISPSQWHNPVVKELQLKAIEVIRQDFGSSHLWGFKDPRTVRVLPFWLEVFTELEVNPKFLLAVRNPLSVAQSLLERNGIAPEKSHLLWLIHVVPYLREIRGRTLTVVDYDLLMADPLAQLERIVSHLGMGENIERNEHIEEYAKEFLAEDLCHSQFSKEDLESDPHLSNLVRAAYHWLHGLARDEVGISCEGFWQAWSDVEKSVLSFSGGYQHMDQCYEQIGILQAYLEGKQKEIDQLSGDLSETLNRCAQLERELIDLHASTSWTVTAPLRRIKNGVLFLGKAAKTLIRR